MQSVRLDPSGSQHAHLKQLKYSRNSSRIEHILVPRHSIGVLAVNRVGRNVALSQEAVMAYYAMVVKSIEEVLMECLWYGFASLQRLRHYGERSHDVCDLSIAYRCMNQLQRTEMNVRTVLTKFGLTTRVCWRKDTRMSESI